MRSPLRIPTIVGLLLVVAVVGSLIFFTERALRGSSKATGLYSPKNTNITNVSDTTFTISWTTDSPATGTILVSSPGKSNRIYYDERDTSGKITPYISHSVTIRDAIANTQYSWKILSNGRAYLDENKLYELKTPATLPPNTSGLEPAYGTIRTPQGVSAEGALVYLTLVGGQKLSALTKGSGLWLVPLTQVRTADLTSFLPTLDRMDESIVVIHQSGEITAMADSLNDSPVPEMTIGQTYDFRRQNAKTTTDTMLALRETSTSTSLPAGQDSAGTTAQLPVGGTVLGTTNGSYRVTLATPAQHASIPTTLPLFSGTGVPNTYVALAIGMTEPISGSVRVQSDGTWRFTPPKALSVGKQSVTIATVDNSGRAVAITHEFEILKSGTQVLGNATPSGSLTITPTPSINLSSSSATPIEESSLSAQEIPTSGYELPTILLMIIGLGLLIGGLAFL